MTLCYVNHTTTSDDEMTKFSLSLWECYIRTEEKCGLLNFSTHGLAVVVKTNSSTRSFTACREYAFTMPAKPLVGNLTDNNSPQYGYSSYHIAPQWWLMSVRLWHFKSGGS